MLYDVFIVSLMMAGITGIVVYSYKIAHSRVYPVGIVRSMPKARPLDPEASRSLDDGLRAFRVAENALSADVLDYALRELRYATVTKEDFPLLLHGPLKIRGRVTRPSSPEEDKSAIEKKVAEQGEALKQYSKMLRELDKRVRQLETDSVEKLQETIEESAQTPKMIH